MPTKEITVQEKADKRAKDIEIVQKLLIANESDTLNVDRRYRTISAKMAAKQELRVERGQLTNALEDLTGRKAVSVEELAAELPKKPPEDGGGDPEKEKVKT